MENHEVEIVNRLGLHARAAAKFVSLASKFESEVKVARNGQEINGKSIMGVMMLAASKGAKIVITTTGADESDAAEKLTELVNNRFGEDD